MSIPRFDTALDLSSPLSFVMAFPRAILAAICLLLFLPGIGALPPVDRDEARFSQASKQMLETGDYIEIQFQEEQRNKKPVGIYWMQTFSNWAFSSPPYQEMWAYRLPSVAGAMLAVLLVFGLGKRLFDTETGFFAGLLLAVSLLVVYEAHTAKTDAMLLGLIVAVQSLIARFYFAERAGEPTPSAGVSILLWGAFGLAILVKGPIVAFVAGTTVLALSIWEGRFRWIWSMRPIFGTGVISLIVLPWLLAIMLVTGGKFMDEAVGRDFAGKLVTSQEGHWGIPGYYLAFLPLTFWPASLFLVPAGIFAWIHRREGSVRFLLAWIIPAWLILELIPTKLPHYVLPFYPALAILCGAAITTAARENATLLTRLPARAGAALWFVITCLLAVLVFLYAPTEYGGGSGFLNIALLVPVIVAAGFAVFFIMRIDSENAAIAACSAGAILVIALYATILPGFERLMVSKKAAALLASAEVQPDRIAVAGYSEPSLVFLAGTKIKFLPGTAAADFLVGTPNAVALVEQSKAEGEFQRRLTEKGYTAETIGSPVSGLNYSKGDEVTLTLYRLKPSGS